MKHTNIFSKWMCLILLSGFVGVSWGQTLNQNGETVSTNRTVNLNNDIVLGGTITINKDVTLTINGNNHTITTFTETGEAESGKNSFVVYGTLIMNNVVLEGGNSGSVGNNVGGGGEGAIEAGKTFTNSGTAIIAYNAAKVELNGVTAKNLYASSKESRASFIYAAYQKTGSTDAIITGRAEIKMNNVTVENCLNNNDAGIIYTTSEYMRSDFTLENCTIRNCMVKANDTGTGYGGVIKGAGKTDCNFTMKNSLLEYCWGSGWGGSVLWAANGNNCKAVFVNCTFQYNYARYLGGAVSSEAVVELINCKILNNTAGFGGGGIAAFPFTLADSEGSNTKQAVGLTLTGNTISGNKTLHTTNKGGEVNKSARVYETTTSQEQTLEKEIDTGFNPRYTILNATDVYYPSGGGGIWVLMNKDEWNCDLNIEAGNTISKNESAYNGGGVFLYKQTPYTRNSGDANEGVTFLNDYTAGGETSMKLAAIISDNKAGSSGGGAAVGADKNLSSFPEVTVEGGEIRNNIAMNGNGGGIYMPGGVFTIEAGNISGNQALIATGVTSSSTVGNGGGIAITEGEFKITASDFSISGNKAMRYGGGLFVYNATKDVTFNGGTFEHNEATAGGGVSLEGTSNQSVVKLTMSANVENNKAINGGGVYLNNHAEMVYTGGLLRNNTAGEEKTDKLENSTAYKESVTEVSGVGGGVFMDNNTTLSFSITNQELGFYGNRAANAADDIFANGNQTSVELPEVENMSLTGFPVPANNLFWAEDYYESDTQYNNGLNGLKSGLTPSHNLRYQYALQNLKREHIVKVTANTYTNKYVCLALGYQIFYVTIKKTGLLKDDSAFFNISSDNNNVPNPYITMLLTGNEKETVEKKIALPEGIWTVTENTDWSWSYTPPTTTSLEKEVKNDNVVYEFTNTKKDENKTGLHDEAIKVNQMGGTSTAAQ